MLPELGLNAPEIKFIIVVLPEPLGPIRPKTSFSTRLNDILSTATRPPKRFDTAAADKASFAASSGMIVIPPEQFLQRGERALHGTFGGAATAAPGILDQPGNAVRYDVNYEQEAHAEQQRRLVGKLNRDRLPHQHERNDTEYRSPQPVRAAEQRHNDNLKRNKRVERDHRFDIAPARGHKSAGDRSERARDDEQDNLGKRGVDAAVDGDDFIVADDAQSKPEARPPDPPADQIDHGGQQQ